MVFGTDTRVLTLAFARMADALGNSFLIIVLPLYIASGQVSLAGIAGQQILGFTLQTETLIGLVLSLFGLLNSFGQPFTGRLSDRTGKRRVFVLTGLVLFAIGSAAYPFLSSYWAVLAARAFQGLGAAFTIPATVALVNDYAASDAERGGNFGVFNTFRLIGFGFGPIIAGVVITGGLAANDVVTYRIAGTAISGFTAAFAIAVLGAVVSLALVWALIQDPPFEAEAGKDLSIAILDRDGEGLDSVFVLGVGTFMMASTIALFATLEGPVRMRLNESTLFFSVQFAAVVIANVVFQVPIGRASDRFGRRPFIVAGFVILVPSVFAQGIVTGPWLMLLARFVQGIAVALVFAPSLALAGDLAGARGSGTTLSVLTMAFGLGVAIGPLASGLLYNFGSFSTPFTAGAALAFVGLVLTYTQVEETLDLGQESDQPAPQD
ncbi:putative MFS family arabinose efflux permease [Haloarcula quadrata]|jgi:MFS family permease|uniref:MFS transporter n=3 Tax=Haloarcula TaxID=2237 RepID=M0JXL0_9EURY|nr:MULTISPECIES: MFS transporter [Haloarcula]EMA13168.1 multidrug resistance protein-like protein [Haloarcula sinaiiensis ATCC 33800]EMA21937.1 multidrug resistance protein-like protein [Haloarcula californiae ATCC 33799]NHX38892.1 MFS transporter [Haloarcula sp. R1-2]QUJ70831.1 MFS transporter [Haloarcula sinaiiensis ATCC 33800]RKS81950.1 putative MFS family arabinose efflux permease [Haloarcula quadrata]